MMFPEQQWERDQDQYDPWEQVLHIYEEPISVSRMLE